MIGIKNMLVINVYVNTRLIDQVGIINTGHRNKDTGQHLYRINHPEDYKKEFNQFEIWHNRKDPWSILVEKILNVINQKKGSNYDMS